LQLPLLLPSISLWKATLRPTTLMIPKPSSLMHQCAVLVHGVEYREDMEKYELRPQFWAT
jgi:hypothetical protein